MTVARVPYVADPDFTTLCECGCDTPAPIATYSHAPRGWVKGQPKRFISGHNARLDKARDFDASYAVEDRGFPTPCWIWQGYLDDHGYGRVNQGRGPELAHRVFFQRAHGSLPPVLHHRCAVTSCVNPSHLQATTHNEHTRIEQAKRTHCRRGHGYAEHGYTRPGGARYCKACERQNSRRRAHAA